MMVFLFLMDFPFLQKVLAPKTQEKLTINLKILRDQYKYFPVIICTEKYYTWPYLTNSYHFFILWVFFNQNVLKTYAGMG